MRLIVAFQPLKAEAESNESWMKEVNNIETLEKIMNVEEIIENAEEEARGVLYPQTHSPVFGGEVARMWSIYGPQISYLA